MKKNYYTENEILLCAYGALYDAGDFGGYVAICSLTGRGLVSIASKIRNIAATLDKYGVARYNSITPLTGRPPGEPARDTNWEFIEPLTRMSRQDLLQRCLLVLGVPIRR